MKPPRSGLGASRPLAFALFFLTMAFACVLVSFLSVRLMMQTCCARGAANGHQWLHEELGLTEEEAARGDVFEAPYQAERQRLQSEFNQRIQTLAALLREQDSLSPEISGAIHEIHTVHGQLQQLAIEHYFDMLSVLPPDKQKRLRELAIEALSTPE